MLQLRHASDHFCHFWAQVRSVLIDPLVLSCCCDQSSNQCLNLDVIRSAGCARVSFSFCEELKTSQFGFDVIKSPTDSEGITKELCTVVPLYLRQSSRLRSLSDRRFVQHDRAHCCETSRHGFRRFGIAGHRRIHGCHVNVCAGIFNDCQSVA